MRYVVSFFSGAVIGALGLFLYLQEHGLPPRASRQEQPEIALAAQPVGVPAPLPQGDNGRVERQVSAPLPSLRPAGPLLRDGLAIPVAGVKREALADHFNDARGGRKHHAIDIAAPRGTPVIAAADGTIRKLFLSNAGGITIYEADPSNQWIYYYAHLDRYAHGLAEGKEVRRGDVIGFVGTTGNAPPNAPHLHFAIERLPASGEWWKGEAVNPYPILVAKGVTFAGAS
ncbi:MAG: M23 family metallopeptidase [Thermoanaerobaculia bacterium]